RGQWLELEGLLEHFLRTVRGKDQAAQHEGRQAQETPGAIDAPVGERLVGPDCGRRRQSLHAKRLLDLNTRQVRAERPVNFPLAEVIAAGDFERQHPWRPNIVGRLHFIPGPDFPVEFAEYLLDARRRQLEALVRLVLVERLPVTLADCPGLKWLDEVPVVVAL